MKDKKRCSYFEKVTHKICRKLIKNIDKCKNISAKYRYMFDLSEKKRKL